MSSILVADDHPLYREALIGALAVHFDDTKFLEAESLPTLMEVLEQNQQISLLLLDLSMPGGECFNGLITVKEKYPKLPVAVVSASDSVDIVAQVMSLGAQGFIPKSTPTLEMAKAIKQISQGHQWVPQSMAEGLEQADKQLVEIIYRFRELTPKQIRVLGYLRNGLMNKQIAHEMNVTEATIKAHISAILRKLEIRTRTQAVLLMNKLQINFEDSSGASQ